MHNLVDDNVIYQISIGLDRNLTFNVGGRIWTGKENVVITKIIRMNDVLISHGISMFVISVRKPNGSIEIWRSIENMPVDVVYNVNRLPSNIQKEIRDEIARIDQSN